MFFLWIVSIGPDLYGGLPGLILAIDIDGENVFLATSIDFTPPPDEILTKPTEGKKTSQKEFDKLVVEKIKEFKEEGPREGVDRAPIRR